MAENDFEPRERENFAAGGDEGMFGDKAPRRYQRRRPRQVVPDYVDWRDIDFLRQFIPERGKIQPRRISGVCALHQRALQTAIKRARQIALVPYTTD